MSGFHGCLNWQPIVVIWGADWRIGLVSTLLHVCLCVGINLQVISDPLRASLASFAYRANTASWYSVTELRFCNTTEVSLPSTTAWGAGVWGGRVEDKSKKAEFGSGNGWEMKEERVRGQRMAGKMENGAINEGRWQWQMEARNERGRPSRKEWLKESWGRGGNTIDLLKEIKYKCL